MQYSLFDTAQNISKWQIDNFSVDNFAPQEARQRIENKYINITEISDSFNRQTVSYQLSKNDCLHRWLKYKEGFSSDLVLKLLKEFDIKKGNTILDPFIGSGTTSMVCKMNGINSIGLDVLPTSKIAINAKQSVFEYDSNILQNLISELKEIELPKDFSKSFQYLSITDGAFPENTEKEIIFFTEWNDNSVYPSNLKNLVTLSILNSLEHISYTAKDGQYLRWDYRSKKMIQTNAERLAKGKNPVVVRLDKGELPSLKTTLVEELQQVYHDIVYIQKNYENTEANLKFIEGNALYELPKLEDEILDGVITSPPYCNRYDYTRTYALELNYLGLGKNEVTKLRQSLLSCTVENKSKIQQLQEFYTSIGKSGDFDFVINILKNNKTLNEIKDALLKRSIIGDINNKGVLRMVEGYFTELAFIYYELFRLCKRTAKVAFVNDNVRYAGEVIPVDFLSTELAEQIGFKPIKIYTLKQLKGNSSQQMAKFGRVALRKSITIWQK